MQQGKTPVSLSRTTILAAEGNGFYPCWIHRSAKTGIFNKDSRIPAFSRTRHQNKESDDAMTAVFDKHGLHFQYPENWEVQENYAKDKALEIYVLAPSGAFWSVMLFDKEADDTALVSEVLRSIQEQYEGFEAEASEDEVYGVVLKGYNTNFFCLDMLVSNRIRSVSLENFNLLLIAQAENREFDTQKAVFDAITTSLIMGLCGPRRAQQNGQ